LPLLDNRNTAPLFYRIKSAINSGEPLDPAEEQKNVEKGMATQEKMTMGPVRGVPRSKKLVAIAAGRASITRTSATSRSGSKTVLKVKPLVQPSSAAALKS
jgi:hypothetical protein